MRKILFTAISTFFIVLFSQAQLKVAIVGGGHQSKIIEENNLPGWDTLQKNYSGRTGVHLGFMADLRLSEKSNFYFQPGVLFYNKGRKYQSPSQDTSVIFRRSFGQPDSVVNTRYFQSRKQFINYIDLPLNLVYKLRLGKKASFMLGAGPYVSFFYNGFHRQDDIVVDVKLTSEENKDLPVGKGSGKYSILDYGVNGLAGFEFGRVFLTANYSRGLNDFYQPESYEASQFRHELMGATLGIFLGKPVILTEPDKDKDGVPDKNDQCPDLAGPAKNLGCPDTDGDGIIDPNDKCPGEAGLAENGGCPGDRDGDGILDKDDKCPDQAGPRENKGCLYPDTDKDGIPDKDDKCPDEPGFARYDGCPIPDTDGDGINNEEDRCPTFKGKKENQGCPNEIKKEIIEEVDLAAKRIQFKFRSADLTQESLAVLDKVASILLNDDEITLTIEGHTSSDGNYQDNMLLSKQRAEKVKQYLNSLGIDSQRLRAIGYGPDKPLNKGQTEKEKAKNRRVELKLSNH